MKTAIIYASTHGTTEKAAKKLASEIKTAETILIDLKKNSKPDISQYDMIVVGGSVHAANMQNKVKSFCKAHIPELLDKPLSLFICGLEQRKMQQQFENAFCPVLRSHCFAFAFAGGELIISNMNLFEKLVIRMVSGDKTDVSNFNFQELESLALKINNHLSELRTQQDN
jgi:menaquinone-dependent protoporphyrinogen oxidase